MTRIVCLNHWPTPLDPTTLKEHQVNVVHNSTVSKFTVVLTEPVRLTTEHHYGDGRVDYVSHAWEATEAKVLLYAGGSPDVTLLGYELSLKTGKRMNVKKGARWIGQQYIASWDENQKPVFDSSAYNGLIEAITEAVKASPSPVLTWERAEEELRRVLAFSDVEPEEQDNIVFDLHEGLDPEWANRQAIRELDAAQDHRTHP